VWPMRGRQVLGGIRGDERVDVLGLHGGDVLCYGGGVDERGL
jgi:hypothetical protein